MVEMLPTGCSNKATSYITLVSDMETMDEQITENPLDIGDFILIVEWNGL